MLTDFLEEIGRIPNVRVRDADAAEQEFGDDTGGATALFGGAVTPMRAEDIAAVVEGANRHGVTLWPTSGARNFGYGTARPVAAGTVLVDLSQLRKVELDGRNLTAVIEPGATQADLAAAIETSGLPLLVPTTGVGPNGNLLGNALDGGYGLTPITDHFEALAAVEGLWGDGTPFRHVYEEFGCPDMAGRWAWGTGPYWAGLLRQGAFGIVTRATLQLARVPEATRILVFEWKTSGQYHAGQEALSRLVEEIPGIGGIIAMNAQRILSTQSDAPLAVDLEGEERARHLEAEIKRRRISRWTAIGTLYGSRAVVRGAVRDLRRRLSGCWIWSFSPNQVSLLERLFRHMPAALLPSIQRHVDSLVHAVGTLEGRPIVAFLRIAYALERNAPPLGLESHPARDGCGILWYAPLVPLEVASTRRYEELMTEVLLRHGFDPLLALTTRSPRILSATIPLIFRRDDPAAVQRAKACYRDLVAAGLKEGWPPYRIGTEYMDQIYPDAQTANGRLYRKLKLALDPKGVISPGRYLSVAQSGGEAGE